MKKIALLSFVFAACSNPVICDLPDKEDYCRTEVSNATDRCIAAYSKRDEEIEEAEKQEKHFYADIVCYSGGREIFNKTVDSYEFENDVLIIEYPLEDGNVNRTSIHADCVAIEKNK